jgi:hypothetical protein
MSRRLLRRLIPRRDAIEGNRMLARLAPLLREPRLWRVSCRGVALGIAIGVFFGLLIPIGQIPFAVVLAFVLRANVGAAAASTLVSNPFTFPPIYVVAYHLGAWLLGVPADSTEAAVLERLTDSLEEVPPAPWWHGVASIGKPLALGLALMAVTGSVAAYLAVTSLWRVAVWLRMRRRARRPP